MAERGQVLNRRHAAADGYSPTGPNRRARKKNGRVPRKLTKQARELVADVACNPPPARTAVVPEKGRRKAANKGDPLADLVALAARDAAQVLLDSWPGLNSDGMPDGGYAMARGLVAEIFYGELARVRGMRRVAIDSGAPTDMRASCELLRERIRQLPLTEITPDHFGCVHEALTGYRFDGGKVVPSSERRKAGAHFTPPDLAAKVVARTLEPLLQCIDAQSPLVLRVCDPAAGAGAFLLAVMRQLAPLVLDRGEASSLHEAKRLVAIHCCHGVDKSRFAVHSCKLAMALEAHADRMPSSWLDDNIKHGDALVGLDSEQIKAFHWKRERAAVPFLDAMVERAMNVAARERQARIADLTRAARGAA